MTVSTNSVQAPQFTGVVNTGKFLEPLNGLQAITDYLGLFPDSLYSKSVDTHFVRFMYAVLGPAGAGGLVQQLLAQRLALESTGPVLNDLDTLYGGSFSFPRNPSESYSNDNDITGLLTASEWAQIRAQDESYRSRAIMFMNAVRLGSSPEGMGLAATSGLGMQVDIYENYRYLFDVNSDDPLGVPNWGSTSNLGEFIIVPRPTTSQTQVFTITMPATLPAPWYITFNGYTTSALSLGSSAAMIQEALGALPSVNGYVRVTGGPTEFIVNFTGPLSNQVLPPLSAYYTLGGSQVSLISTVTVGSIPANEEQVIVPPEASYAMQYVLDQLRPVASYPSFQYGTSWLAPQPYQSVTAETELNQVLRYVTGSTAITWPEPDNSHWIQASVENEAPTLYTNLSQSYTGFHNVQAIYAYTDTALEDVNYATNNAILNQYSSVHVGPFPEMSTVMPWFNQFRDYGLVFSPDRALAAYTEPLFITDTTASGVAVINNMYPADYLSLQGVPTLKYRDQACWSSLERSSGGELLEIDLGTPQAVNFISFEVTRKPLDISVAYDLLDQSPARNFASVVPEYGFPPNDAIYYEPSSTNPWEHFTFHFNDGIGMIYTRFIRLAFSRRFDPGFLFDAETNETTPWSVDVRNLRIGRNISPSVM